MQKKVLTSDGYVSTFDKQKIIDEIRKNCKSMGVEVTEKQLTKIATNTEESIKEMKPKHLTGSLIRSVSLIEMLDLGLEDVYKACAKVGMPIADMMAIWQVDGDSVHDNANLDGTNQETQHKRIADHICKEAVLQMLPSDISKLHVEGNLHCLSGDMPIVYKIQDKIYISTIKELVETRYESAVSVPSIDTRTKKISWKPVTRFIKNPSTDLYKVTFGKGRYIICTSDHPFYKTSGQHIQHYTQPLSDLRVGHRIATLNHIPIDDVQDETYRGNLIGFFLGDGTLQHGCICFHLKKTEKITYLINVLNHLDKSYDMTNNIDGTTTISFKDDELCEIWNNSKNISNFNEVDATGILSGLINSDASIVLHGINKLPYLEFGNTNEDIINLYHCLMLMHGINVSYQRYDKKSDTHKDFYHCVCSGEDVTNLLCKLRLRKPFADRVAQQFTHGTRKTHTWSQIPIKSIEYYGNEDTYDITVDENHNFLAGHGFILSGNCHDMEYFTNRQFCYNSDLRFILYYGLLPDGCGKTLPVARAAQTAEVALLHAAKSLGSSQCNCAGGQGYNSFNVLISPYLAGKTYAEIKQLAQMFIYEMGQMTCARGGQSLSYDTPIVIKRGDDIDIISIGDFVGKYLNQPGSSTVDDIILTPSLNRITNQVEWKPITHVYKHVPKSKLVATSLHDGRSVTTTEDHSLFDINQFGDIYEISPSDNPHTIITVKQIPITGSTIINHDLAFLIGCCIGDGSLAANNGIPDTSMRLCIHNRAVMNRISDIVYNLNGSAGEWHEDTQKKCSSMSFSTIGIPLITEIGKGASNKRIPAALLSCDNDTLLSLLDGLLSTDGNINRRRYQYSTTSKILINQIEYILRRIDLDYHIDKRFTKSNFVRNHPVYRVTLSTISSLGIKITNDERTIVNTNIISQQRHDFSIMKSEITSRVPGLSKYSYTWRASSRRLKYHQLEQVSHLIPDTWNKICNILPMEVKSIKITEPEEFVFDIGVQDNENFVLANGIVAHNSVFSSIQLYPGVPQVWWNRPVVYKGQVWDGKPRTPKGKKQTTCKWSFGGKTGDGRLFFNRSETTKETILEPETISRKTYGQYDREARLLFKAFMEIYTEGDIRGRPFTFPKAEIVFSKEFMDSPDFDKPIIRRLTEWSAPSYKEQYQSAIKLALTNGTPYFESQYHEENPLTSINCTQCCAYSFALSEEETVGFNNMMDFVDGAHFDSLGSMQVVSLNLPRAAYVALESEEEDKFMTALKYLREQIDNAVRVFKIKREYLSKQASPFIRQQVVDPNDPTKKSPVFCDLSKLTYVIGMVGLNEFVQALTGMQLHESEDAVVMGERLIGSLNLYCGKVGHENGMSIALARTPAETTAQRFAVQDLIKYPKYAKKYVKGNLKEAIKMLPTRRDVPIQYSNGTHLAVDAPVTLDKKIEIEGRFFGVLKGGNIFHVFLDDVVPMLRASELGTGEIHPSYVDDAMEFVFKIFRETPINYLAITKDSTICDDCNSITPGVNEKCPKCGSTNVDFFSRITGYLEPISQWNAAKKQEFFDRHRYGEKDVRG